MIKVEENIEETDESGRNTIKVQFFYKIIRIKSDNFTRWNLRKAWKQKNPFCFCAFFFVYIYKLFMKPLLKS